MTHDGFVLRLGGGRSSWVRFFHMVQEMEAETPLSSACETLLMVEVYSEHKLGKKKKAPSI